MYNVHLRCQNYGNDEKYRAKIQKHKRFTSEILLIPHFRLLRRRCALQKFFPIPHRITRRRVCIGTVSAW